MTTLAVSITENIGEIENLPYVDILHTEDVAIAVAERKADCGICDKPINTQSIISKALSGLPGKYFLINRISFDNRYTNGHIFDIISILNA